MREGVEIEESIIRKSNFHHTLLVLLREPFPLKTSVLVVSATETWMGELGTFPVLKWKLPEPGEMPRKEGLALHVLWGTSPARITGHSFWGKR